MPLDGEFWLGRKQFQRTISIIRRHDPTALWKEVRFRIFYAPAALGGFEQRLEFVCRRLHACRPLYADLHSHTRCSGRQHLQTQLALVESLGGEGLMLRQPG